MEQAVRAVIMFLVPLVEACSVLVVVLGVVNTLVVYLRCYFRTRAHFSCAPLRFQFDQTLVMGLEFQVAADILKTAVAPTWDEILRLMALIVIRTGLSYVLKREIGNREQEPCG
ncbi:MAG: DUF1622 domain-containing protein [Chloroflexi bacterium]|nr:DUF1622 domain-containing protein [Chloroflexota bacterium]